MATSEKDGGEKVGEDLRKIQVGLITPPGYTHLTRGG